MTEQFDEISTCHMQHFAVAWILTSFVLDGLYLRTTCAVVGFFKTKQYISLSYMLYTVYEVHTPITTGLTY